MAMSEEINIPQIVDLIRSLKVSREDAIGLLTKVVCAARSGGEADATRDAGESMLRAFDEAAAKAAARFLSEKNPPISDKSA
jgi:hypothetical protein